MKEKNKGFTLIEILAAVTILGVLSIVAIVSVNKVIQKSKQNHYITSEENIKMAGQSYVQQNRNYLPKVIGQKRRIPLKTLVDKNYIEQIKDYNGNDCDLNSSYVQVFKYSQNDYSYITYLDCPVYNSKEQLEKGAPRAYIILSDETKTKKAMLSMKVEDDEKLLSWSYIIYKNGKEVLNSGSMLVPEYDKSVEKEINISKYTPGKIKVVVTVTNIYGLTRKKTSEVVEYKDTKPPVCIIKEVDKEENPKEWTKENRTITVGCNDGEGSGCTREEYTVTFKRSTKIGEIEIEDESGNTSICRVSTYVDKDPPICTVKLTGTKGNNDWYKNRNVEIELTRRDDHSGVAGYDLKTTAQPSYNGISTATQTDVEKITWYGYIMDNVGNVNECTSGSFKVDTTPPQCTISLSGTTGNNGWYKEKKVSITLNPSDALSGVGQTGLSTNATPSLGSVKTGTQGDTTGVTWYGRVQDKAGNISSVCTSGSFKVDATKPSISWNKSAGPHDSNTGITVSTKCTDAMSGVSSHSGSEHISSPTSGTKKTHSCTDKAGNTSSTSRTFKVRYFSATDACTCNTYNSCPACTEKYSCTKPCTRYCCTMGGAGESCGHSYDKTGEGGGVWVCSPYTKPDCAATCKRTYNCEHSSCGCKIRNSCWHY